jgi:hypothetical protein
MRRKNIKRTDAARSKKDTVADADGMTKKKAEQNLEAIITLRGRPINA